LSSKRFLFILLLATVICITLALTAGAGVALAAAADGTDAQASTSLTLVTWDAGTAAGDTLANTTADASQSAPQGDISTDKSSGTSTGAATPTIFPEDPAVETSGSESGSSATTAVYLGSDAFVSPDHDGDGSTEVTVLYDLGWDTAGLYVFEPTTEGYAAAQRVWTSAPGAWDWRRSKLVTTDHDGDGHTEVSVLYNLYYDTAALYVFEPTDSGYSDPQRVWTSAPGTWDWKRTKLVATDYDGDGRTEITALYDFYYDSAALYIFDPTDTGFNAPHQVWNSGPGGWDWKRSKMVATDYNGDGSTEVAAIYNLYGDTAGLYVFEPTSGGFAPPQRVWTSTPGTWDWTRTKIVATDHDGDGNSEVSALYDFYGNTAALYVFEPTTGGFAAPQQVWASAPGSYDAKRSKIVTTDHDGDGSTEIAALYDLGSDTTGLYLFDPTPGGFAAPQRVWTSPAASWDWRRSKTSEDSFTPRVTFVGIAWIDINLSIQTLTAIGMVINEVAEGCFYNTTMAVFSSLTATGGPGYETPTGLFHVYSKNVAIDMSGPGYYAPNVPYVLWFNGPYSIHGTYWHNLFGVAHSHGCVNLPTPNAIWLFERVPVGMPVLVHY